MAEIWWKTERGTSAGTASVPILLLSLCLLLENLFSQNDWENDMIFVFCCCFFQNLVGCQQQMYFKVCATNTKTFPRVNMPNIPYFNQNVDYGEHQSALSSVADFGIAFYSVFLLYLWMIEIVRAWIQSMKKNNPRCGHKLIFYGWFSLSGEVLPWQSNSLKRFFLR